MALEFDRPLEDLVIEALQPIPYKLDCELSRKPRTPPSWTKDGKPLLVPASEKRVRMINEGTTQSLVFETLTDTDVGQYAIQVEHISSEAKIAINGKWK